jgi:hypothetical protein
MADPFKPGILTLKSLISYTGLLAIGLVGGYFWYQQRSTTEVKTQSYAIDPEASQYICATIVNNALSRFTNAYIRSVTEKLTKGEIDYYLSIDGQRLYIGKTEDEAVQGKGQPFNVDKNTGDQLVVSSIDTANPVNDRMGSMVLDKTNGVGLYKDAVNHKFFYLKCEGAEF